MQIQLMKISQSLKLGQQIIINKKDMIEAAKQELSSRLFDSVRPGDVQNLAKKIEKNWDVQMIHILETGNWIMYKKKYLTEG